MDRSENTLKLTQMGQYCTLCWNLIVVCIRRRLSVFSPFIFRPSIEGLGLRSHSYFGSESFHDGAHQIETLCLEQIPHLQTQGQRMLCVCTGLGL